MKKLLLLAFCVLASFGGQLHSKTMKKFDNNTKCCSMLEQALFIIKPDAVADNNIGEILEKLEGQNLRIIGMKMTRLTKEEIDTLYKAHKSKSHFQSLSKYMGSGPVVLTVIEGPDAIKKTRKLAGLTDPSKAKVDTLRSRYGTDVQRNAVHVSDSVKSSKKEIPLFFRLNELYSPCAKEVFKTEKTNEDQVSAQK
ncbi:MAG: Nucleoside diphosphate kinase [Chlamydiia bacterium]|nr:Nucleoside diphosphate kinase [Chlamydiia bacterium]